MAKTNAKTALARQPENNGAIQAASGAVNQAARQTVGGLLQSMLGFDQEAQALMIALYIAMDSFGTACNVTGDGAIALIVDKITGRNFPTTSKDSETRY